ncbi:DUF3786 domain-containing protein [Candidatus Formimonas warabiya]|uniref:DUF3786 domain-containing protein n=1 Tax=Formimonas warabiya TaxID=1761012 RepID=A0A3G1KVY7_FORW1|nr:DUF3786 domain-containing protein [Candidatus Formimonas warabiya]ATW26658.1 hypothetical protein DCMF_19560 [Candidatus Formimonas warabiya]
MKRNAELEDGENMLEYMIERGNVGSYQNTYDHTLRIFASKDPKTMADHSGTEFDAEKSEFTLESLGQKLHIKFPEGTIRFSGSNLAPLWPWRLIMLNHLARADNAPLSREVIPFRETESGNIFHPAFLKRSIHPLINHFSDKPVEKIKSACLQLGAQLQEGADVCAIFPFLPRFPVILKIWLKDEEMNGSANILFNASANHYLHTEDIAVAGSTVVNFLIAQYECMFS